MPDAALATFGISENVSGAMIGAADVGTSGAKIQVRSPIDLKPLASVTSATPADVAKVIDAAAEAFVKWRDVPAPKRGEFVRRLGEKLRERKAELARIVQLEVGKITQEALGEVQEMIDICDYAVGLSRQLYGLTIASERPGTA
jgi:aldehyde dehydrogenase (NAD+)